MCPKGNWYLRAVKGNERRVLGEEYVLGDRIDPSADRERGGEGKLREV